MAEPNVYLEKLSAFGRLLRMKGLSVSPKETGDAAEILTVLGLSDREQVKTALRTVYAKSREEQLIFDGVFDGFFLSEEAMRQQAKQQMEQEQEMARRREEAREELEQYGNQPRLTPQQQETYMTMSEEARQKLKQFMQRYKGNTERNPALYSEFIHSVFTKTILEQQLLMENAGENVMESDPELGILYKDLGEFRDTDIPKAIDIIQKIARQINGELSARKKSHGTSSKLDFRKTIRKGLETGGTFHRLEYRRKRQHRKRLVVLCDVSGSMVQFSEFALRFIQSLNQVSEGSEVYLFSEKLVKANPFQLENMDSFRSFVKESGIYGRGTDLGTALEILCDPRQQILGSGATLLILSDTKTIDQNRAVQAVLEAKRRSGRVIWLNPIPEGKWQYLRSVQVMAELVTMIPCSTLRELAGACRRLV